MKPWTTMTVCVLIATVQARAAPVTLALPQETASLKASNLPGYAVARQQYVICHSADYKRFQPPNLTLAQWTEAAAKMQHLYGAPLSEQVIALVGAYLAVAYGNAREEELPAALRDDGAAVSSPSPPGKMDARELPTRNGCLGCHAVNKRVVGLSDHEVALKYRDDTAAPAKVQDSMRRGSTGKWGTCQCPRSLSCNRKR